MKLKSITLIAAAALCSTACIVAPPHVRYAQASVGVAVVPSAPVYAPAPAPIYAPPVIQVAPPQVYYAPPPPVYFNPWIVPNIGLNLWWGRQWGGGGHNHNHRR